VREGSGLLEENASLPVHAPTKFDFGSNAMDHLKHLPSPIAPTFSEALRMPDKGSVTFEQEVRTTFERIRDSLGKLGAGMNHVVSIKTYLTDLGPYTVFSRIRGEFFSKDPPTSTAVQVAGLLLNAKIEIDAVAFLPVGSTT
jgi:hypothetical protein